MEYWHTPLTIYATLHWDKTLVSSSVAICVFVTDQLDKTFAWNQPLCPVSQKKNLCSQDCMFKCSLLRWNQISYPLTAGSGFNTPTTLNRKDNGWIKSHGQASLMCIWLGLPKWLDSADHEKEVGSVVIMKWPMSWPSLSTDLILLAFCTGNTGWILLKRRLKLLSDQVWLLTWIQHFRRILKCKLEQNPSSKEQLKNGRALSLRNIKCIIKQWT